MCLFWDIGAAVSQTEGPKYNSWAFQHLRGPHGGKNMLLTDGANCCPKMCDVVGIFHASVPQDNSQ